MVVVTKIVRRLEPLMTAMKFHLGKCSHTKYRCSHTKYKCSHTKYYTIFYSRKLKLRIFYFKFAWYKSSNLLKDKNGLGGFFVSFLNSNIPWCNENRNLNILLPRNTKCRQWDLSRRNFFALQCSFSLVHTVHSFLS